MFDVIPIYWNINMSSSPEDVVIFEAQITRSDNSAESADKIFGK